MGERARDAAGHVSRTRCREHGGDPSHGAEGVHAASAVHAYPRRVRTAAASHLPERDPYQDEGGEG